MKLNDICKHCENEEFEFKGIQTLELKGQQIDLRLYTCNCCKGHETYVLEGHRLTDDNYNALLNNYIENNNGTN